MSIFLRRLSEARQEKRYYDVLQICKSITTRYKAKKKFAEAISILSSEADFLLEEHQNEAGIEISCLILDNLVSESVELSDEHLSTICQLLKKMKPSEDRARYIVRACAFLSKDEARASIFQHRLSEVYWLEGNLSDARSSIIKSCNGFQIGHFLISLNQECGQKGEVELFITQAVLQLLCAQKVHVASLSFYVYTRFNDHLEPGPPFVKRPLLNFVWYLILCVVYKHNLRVFTTLCNQYRPALNRDPAYKAYLVRIGQLYFGVVNTTPNIATSSGANPMNNIMSQLMGMFNGSSGNWLESGNSNDHQEPSDCLQLEDID